MSRVLLKFPKNLIDKPITSQVILELGIPLNIVSAHIDSYGGEILVEVASTALGELSDAFSEKGVIVAKPELIEKDESKCMNCGACVSLCPLNAISLDSELSVVFDREKCVGSTCRNCIDGCPVAAIRLVI